MPSEHGEQLKDAPGAPVSSPGCSSLALLQVLNAGMSSDSADASCTLDYFCFMLPFLFSAQQITAECLKQMLSYLALLCIRAMPSYCLDTMVSGRERLQGGECADLSHSCGTACRRSIFRRMPVGPLLFSPCCPVLAGQGTAAVPAP